MTKSIRDSLYRRFLKRGLRLKRLGPRECYIEYTDIGWHRQNYIEYFTEATQFVFPYIVGE